MDAGRGYGTDQCIGGFGDCEVVDLCFPDQDFLVSVVVVGGNVPAPVPFQVVVVLVVFGTGAADLEFNCPLNQEAEDFKIDTVHDDVAVIKAESDV